MPGLLSMRKALAELYWRLFHSRRDFAELYEAGRAKDGEAYATELAVFRLGGPQSLHAVRNLSKTISGILDS